MADLDSCPLSFKGTSPEECETFVATIRQRALAQGKHRDNEWIAFLASSYFVGDVLYWYEGLGEDVQADWSRLRPALLARFGRGGRTSTTTSGAPSTPSSAPFTTILTPAAAPPALPPRPSVRRGRLKAIDSDGTFRGYIAKPDEFGLYERASTCPDDALLVSFIVSSVDEPFEIQIIDASQFPQVGDTLAMFWARTTGPEWLRDNCPGILCLFSHLSDSGCSVERKVWRISKDAELRVEYPKPDGGTEWLSCSISPTGEVYFKRSTANIPAPILSLTGLNNLVGALTGRTQPTQRDRIIFEDVI